MGNSGCVSYMFDKKGQIIIDKEECDMDPDELMMMALDAGAEDFNEEDFLSTVNRILIYLFEAITDKSKGRNREYPQRQSKRNLP